VSASVRRESVGVAHPLRLDDPDLPTQPTPSGILGHDEDGKGEVIDTTPAADEPPAVPADTPPALLAPSAARTTKPKSRVQRPKAAAQRLLAEGKPLRAVARDLGVPESTLRSWRKKLEQGPNV
jgi:hypothetical protein